MTDQEKVDKVIDLYNQGLNVDDIAFQVGYSHPKSLTRFMTGMNYKWDNRKKNYEFYAKGAETNRAPIKDKEVTSQKSVDPLDLLENQDVLSLLQQSGVLLQLIDKQKVRSNNLSNSEKSSYSFWKKAQEFAFMRKASYTTSVRLPVELNDRLNKFKSDTNLTQTQILCMSLDFFIARFDSKVTKN